MSRAIQKKETCERVLRAAESLLEEDPSASIGAIAKRAEVAKSTLFFHFGTREALIDALLERYNAELGAKLLSASQRGAGAPEPTVRAVAGVALDHWAARPGLLGCFVRHAAARSDLRAARAGINPIAFQFVAQALAGLAGGRSATVDLVTHGLLGLWTRVGLQYVYEETIERESAVDVLTRMTLGALSAVLTED